ncbi:hypothetical protein [Streptomyces sp. NRRL B-2790]|uniref:hypothetical protein n=1 Tax=Streptomyces sp. NRRL B-2790 TaxID=1463835 RepID=UPI000AEA6C36
MSVAPDLGIPIPGSRPELRKYADDVDDVRIIYYVSALRTTIVVAYLEALPGRGRVAPFTRTDRR